MTTRITILGAGFAGLEAATILSERLGPSIDLHLIDQSDAFVFGYSKLDVLFGRATAESVRIPYRLIHKPGVHFHQESISEIDPERRRVRTSGGTYESDILIVALGADYDIGATPGLAESQQEFYSLKGAEALGRLLPQFSKGSAVIGVTSLPFKCPPAPSEAALLLDDYLVRKGVRGNCTVSLVMPFGAPIPPAPAASKALLAAFAERGITWIPQRLVTRYEAQDHRLELDDGTKLPCDLLFGVPAHKAPPVVVQSGMTVDGWIPVNPNTLETRYPGVYAAGDVTEIEVPKAGVFSEGAARVAAASIVASLGGGAKPPSYSGAGSCYVEFGKGQVGRVDVDFLSGPSPNGTFRGPSEELLMEKKEFGASRRKRWFGA